MVAVAKVAGLLLQLSLIGGQAANKNDLIRFGHALQNDGRIAEAEEVYRRVTRQHPAFPDGWFDLGLALEADADFEPVRLDFSNDAEDEDMIERELLDTIDGDTDAVVHELPEPDEPGCSRAPYQRFLSQYRRWVQRQLALEEDDAGRARLSAKLSMKARTPAQKTRLAQQFWSDPACRTSEEDKAAILAQWRQKTQNPGRPNRWFRQCAGLWTYNGDWGIMEEITVPMTRSASAQDEIQWVVHQCQNSKRLLALWQDVQKFWSKTVLV